MKKIYLFLTVLVLLGISTTLVAQKHIGIRAGYQLGNLVKANRALLNQNYSTFYVGIFKEKKLLPLIRFSYGVDYLRNGSISDTSKITLHYISVPLALKAKLGAFFAMAGLAPSIKVGEVHTINGIKESISKTKSNIFDAPAFVGVGFKIAIISLEARYYLGFINVNDNSASGFKDYRNQYFQLGLAVSL